MLQPVNTLVAEFDRANATQNYPHQAFRRGAQNHHMKVAEIFARMVGTDHKMAHSIANDRESTCRSCPWLPSHGIPDLAAEPLIHFRERTNFENCIELLTPQTPTR